MEINDLVRIAEGTGAWASSRQRSPHATLVWVAEEQ